MPRHFLLPVWRVWFRDYWYWWCAIIQTLVATRYLNCTIDPLHWRHAICGISVHVYYPEATILEYRNTLASYAVSIETCPYITVKHLYSLHSTHFIQFNTYIYYICAIYVLEALLVHDCICRDRHRGCYLHKRKIAAKLEYPSVPGHFLEMMTSCATGLLGAIWDYDIGHNHLH